MKRYILALAFICTAPLAQAKLKPDAPRPEVGPYVRVYTGAEGLRVAITRVGPREKNEALVEISGIDHDWNNKILLHKVAVDQRNGDEVYTTKLPDKEWKTIQDSEGQRRLYLPGLPKPLDIRYSEEASKNQNPELLLTEYLKNKN